MTVKVDTQKKQFESSFLKAFSALTRMSQNVALQTAREHVEAVLAMYNDGYTAMETAQYLRQLIDIDQIKHSQSGQPLTAGWK